MEKGKACQLWYQCCCEVVGCDQDGNELDNPTKLGVVATSHGLEYYNLHKPEYGNAVADFLEMWASAIRNKD